MKKTIIILIVITVAILLIFMLITDKIDLSEYQTSFDYGSLSKEQIEVMNSILLCGANGDTNIKQDLSQEEFDEVIEYIGLYFGSTLAYKNVALWRPEYAVANVELLRKLEQDKAIIDTKIDSILSNMYEGTDEFKLLQISNYLTKTIKYSYLLDDIEPLSGLYGKGSCMTYSMLFYKMATRIGIQTCICYGKADNGERVALHAWNMVVLDGERYFYDITWYDTIVRDLRYIHSRTVWGRNFKTYIKW